jgi:hypothetical protein
MFAVLRSLAIANAENPTFAAQLSSEYERRRVGQLTSVVTDDLLDLFKQSFNHLLPPSLKQP